MVSHRDESMISLQFIFQTFDKAGIQSSENRLVTKTVTVTVLTASSEQTAASLKHLIINRQQKVPDLELESSKM